jgi:hypothetical protein
MTISLALSFDGTWNTVRDQPNVFRIHAGIASTDVGVGPADVPLEFVRWVVLTDGGEDLLRQVYAAARCYKVEIIVMQDFVHVLEYLWKAAHALHPEAGEEREAWVMDRASVLLQGNPTNQAQLEADRAAIVTMQAALFEDVATTARLMAQRMEDAELDPIVNPPPSKSEAAMAMLADGQGDFRHGHRYWV